LNKSGLHKQIIKESLEKQIWISWLNLDELQFEKILKWEEIEVVDISGKKTKIKLDLQYVFYLLGECANESIWINLKWVTIKTKTDENNEDDEETVDGRWVKVVDGDKTYSSGIYTDSVGSNAEIDYARKNNVNVWAGYTNVPEIRPPEFVPPDPNQWTGFTPNQWTGPTNANPVQWTWPFVRDWTSNIVWNTIVGWNTVDDKLDD
jgi:hypothetical protein